MKRNENHSIRGRIQFLVKQIEKNGHERTARGMKTRELTSVIFGITRKELMKPLGLTTQESVDYTTETDIIGGQRFYEKLEEVIARLTTEKLTRQAVLQLEPAKDSNIFPCQSAWHFLLEGELLNVYILQRSLDVEKNMFIDVKLADDSVQCVAKEVGLKPGNIRFYISSAHIYVE